MNGAGRISALDGLRGICAANVVIYHCLLINKHLLTDVLPVSVFSLSGSDVVAKIVLSILNGAIAVQVFFALSGFVLKRAFERLPGDTFAASFEFVIRRLFRIYPAVAFCMIFCFLIALSVISLTHGTVRIRAAMSVQDLVLNGLLLSHSVQGATWTLQVEVLAILPLLGMFLFSRYFGTMVTVVALCYSLVTPHHPWLLANILPLIGTLPYFIAGAFMAEPVVQKVLRNLPLPPFMFLGALIALKIFFAPNGQNAAILLPVNVLITALAIGALSTRSKTTFFECAGADVLGRASYSLYLLNVPFIWLFSAIFPLGSSVSGGLILAALVLLYSIPLSMLSERFIERPSQQFGRDVIRRISTLVRRPNVQFKVSEVS